MTRRCLVLALPQVIQQAIQPYDQFRELEKVWNPFAERLNQGVLDLKQWKRVVDVVNRIDGRKCK